MLAKCRQLREQIRQKAKKQQDRNKRIADIDHLSDDSSTFDSDEEYKESDKKVKKEKAKTKPKISLDILKGKSIVEVSEMSSTEVVESIEAIAIRIANQVLMKKGFSMEIPSRSSCNQVSSERVGNGAWNYAKNYHTYWSDSRIGEYVQRNH